jgi:xanthine dehydrogenase accessory factor
MDFNNNIYKDLLDTLDKGKKAVMVTSLNSNGEENEFVRSTTLITKEDLESNNTKELEYDLYKKAQDALESGCLQFICDSDKDAVMIEPYFPEPKLIILGGGHIAKPLVEFAAKVGFGVTVVDDRPFFANQSRFPDAERVICESFENCFKLLNLNESSFVVIVTRGHRHDLHCLKETLNYDTAYVGMIGSKRRIKIVRDQLLDEGYSSEKLDKVNAPIGIDINAVSPEEIAISILAQLISYRRSKTVVIGGATTHKVNYPEFDRIVIEELAKGIEEPKAVVTIVSTKGSVPRKSGAKMIVYSDGRIIGSIGGGCSEGEVIVTAREIIRKGGFKIQKVDMTGQVAEEEGMVCGGIMEVLIERLNL